MITAIVPAAGSGKRFQTQTNKTLYTFLDKPLFIWPLQVLQEIKEINDILPVVRHEDIKATYELIEKYKITKVKKIVHGGKERQDSVYNALQSASPYNKVILIHDGARPFLEIKLIQQMIHQLMSLQSSIDGIITGVPVKDTLKEIQKEYSADNKEDIYVRKTLKRELIWAIHTPQLFFFERLKAAYEKAIKDNFYATDDSALIERYGGKIRVIMDSYKNIKITTPEDIKIAEALL